MSGWRCLPATYGQAIIGYGINVGRAGAAGVGAGAGLGGVFSNMKRPIEQAGQAGTGTSQTGKKAGPQFDNDKIPKGNGQAKVGADGKLKLKGGSDDSRPESFPETCALLSTLHGSARGRVEFSGG